MFSTAASATVHPNYARALCVLMRQHGLEVEPALAAVGLDPAVLAQWQQPVAVPALVRLALLALQGTGKPWLGLALGRLMQASAHGLVGHAVLTSRDMGELMQTIARYGSQRTDALRFVWTPTATGGALAVQEVANLGPARRFVLDTLLTLLLGLLDAGAGQRPAGLRASLPFEAPPWLDAYTAQTGLAAPQLWFGAPELALSLPDASLRLPCITADAKAHAAACEACAQVDLDASVPPSAVTSVRAQLLQAVPGSFPTLDAVARALHRSPRTLMRQLQQEGSRYQTLLDEVRKARALAALRGSDQTVEDIAAQLGFADTSNFSRTSRRWFGLTPRQLRNAEGLPDQTPASEKTPGVRVK